MSSILRDLGRIQGRAGEANRAREEVNRELSELRDRVRKGETTGDRVLDLVLAKGGLPGDEVDQRFRAISAELSGKVGQPVLVCTREERMRGCPGISAPDHIDPSFYGLETTIELGVLASDALAAEGEHLRMLIPTDAHAVWRGEGEPNLAEGPIREAVLSPWGLCYSTSAVRKGRARIGRRNLAIEIVTGARAVADWLEEEHLGVIGFRMAQLLGLSLPETPSVTRALEQRRTELLEKLEGLWVVRKRAGREWIRGRATRRPPEWMDEKAAERDRLAAEIRSLMSEAVELGLGEDPLIAEIREGN